MADFTLVIGNKNYSSWSLRGWLMAKAAGIEFEEIVVPQNQVAGRLAVVFKGPAGYRFQSVNSGFEGTITGLGAIPGDPTPSLIVAVTRYYGVISNAGDTQIIMTIPE